jgi:aerobic carbon-monoxide dehydrogenase medium subunit
LINDKFAGAEGGIGEVKPHPFEYAKAPTLDAALTTLSEFGDGAQILAGGQSLIATLNMRLSEPKILIDINGLDDLATIALEDGQLRIGALARQVTVEHSPVVREHAPLIAQAMPHIAHLAIRNRGTIGGSIAFADPAAELPACALALDAEIEIAGRAGRRRVAAGKFYKGLYETDIATDELVTAVLFPLAGARRRTGFAEIARRHGDYAVVGLAAAENDEGAATRLAYFGVGPTPIRARLAEAALAGGSLDDAADALGQDLDPPDDLQASGKTRLQLARVLLRRVIAEMGRQG